MDVHLGQELLDELGSSLEQLETQQGALLQFLKDKGVVTDEDLAPYLTQAGNASNVRWRATRVRLEHLFSSAQQKEAEANKQQAQEKEHGTREQQKEQEKGQGSGKQQTGEDADKETPAEKGVKAENPDHANEEAEDEEAKAEGEKAPGKKNLESGELNGVKTKEEVQAKGDDVASSPAKSKEDAKRSSKGRDEKAA